MQPEVYNQSVFLTTKAAYLYYIKNLPQNQIASILKVSVPTVSRLINKARADKIIEFVIKDPYLKCIDLEQKLKEKYGLLDVIIAPDPAIDVSEDIDSEKKLIALEGARYLQRIIKEEDVLGITFGRTMYHLIHYLNPCQKINTQFVTLHGSINNVHQDFDVIPLVRRIAMAFGGKNYTLITEGIVSNKELANSIKQEKNIKKVIDMYKNVSIAISGIGSFYPTVNSLLTKSKYLSEEQIAMLKKEDVVADVFLRFINKHGKECNTELRDRTIGIKYEEFKNINKRIVLASGLYKKDSLKIVLKAGLYNILITNYSLGKELIEN